MAKLFISYAREDQVLAVSLRNELSKRGISCWLDAYDIKAGAQWEELMIQQLRQAQHVLFLHSQFSAIKGGAVAKEYDAALSIARTKPIESSYLLVLNLDNSLPRTAESQKYHWLDFSMGFYQCIENIRSLCRQGNQTYQAEEKIEQDARYSRIIAALLERDFSSAKAMAEANTAYMSRDGIQHLLYALACLSDQPVRGLNYKQALEIHHQLSLSIKKGTSMALASRALLALKLDYFGSNHVTSPAPSTQDVYTLTQCHALNGIEYDLFENINTSNKTRLLMQQ